MSKEATDNVVMQLGIVNRVLQKDIDLFDFYLKNKLYKKFKSFDNFQEEKRKCLKKI